MPPFRKPSLVTLRRQDLSIPWGFRLVGGVNHGQPFVVQKVTPDSISFKSGLQEGDELVRIGNITLRGLTHEEVQEIILRCSSTIDLFVIRKEVEDPQNQYKDQQNLVNTHYNKSLINSYSPENIAKSLTEQIQVVNEGAYYTNSLDHNSPTLRQIYLEEQESYQHSNYHSPSLTKRPQSPLQKPPPSGRPFSPTMSRPFSPTSAISYHQAEEQQWLSTAINDQHRDTRVFASKPRPPSSSPSPVPDYMRTNDQQRSSPVEQQRDTRVFGSRPRSSSSPSPSPVPDYLQMNEQNWSPDSEGHKRDNRIFGSQPRPPPSPTPLQEIQQQNGQKEPTNESHWFETEPKTPTAKSPSNEDSYNYSRAQQNQKAFDSQFPQNKSTKDNRVFGMNKRPDTYQNPGYVRPPIGRVVNDRRVFGKRHQMQNMGGSFDEARHWKEPLPQLQCPQTDQLLPSQTKQQQTYIAQTPPTEKMMRPPLTGNIRRRIRPVWPPPDANGRLVSKVGFNPGGRDSPNKRYNWPPAYDEDYYYEEGMTSPTFGTGSPRLKYATPPPGGLQHAWHPRSGSATPTGMRSRHSSGRVQNTQWPPPSNATPAGRSGFRPQTSLPGSRRSSQVNEYLVYGVNNRIPQTYRPPPGTQYFEPTYHYDTD